MLRAGCGEGRVGAGGRVAPAARGAPCALPRLALEGNARRRVLPLLFHRVERLFDGELLESVDAGRLNGAPAVLRCMLIEPDVHKVLDGGARVHVEGEPCRLLERRPVPVAEALLTDENHHGNGVLVELAGILAQLRGPPRA